MGPFLSHGLVVQERKTVSYAWGVVSGIDCTSTLS